MPAKRPSALPSFLTAMAAVAVKQPPEGEAWPYEVKCDGYRLLIITAPASSSSRAITGTSLPGTASVIDQSDSRAVLEPTRLNVRELLAKGDSICIPRPSDLETPQQPRSR